MSVAPPAKQDTSLLKVAPHVVSRMIQGRALVLDANQDEIQQLNEVGSYLWGRLLEGTETELSLAQGLTTHFEVELEEALSDVEQFIAALIEAKLVFRG